MHLGELKLLLKYSLSWEIFIYRLLIVNIVVNVPWLLPLLRLICEEACIGISFNSTFQRSLPLYEFVLFCIQGKCVLLKKLVDEILVLWWTLIPEDACQVLHHSLLDLLHVMLWAERGNLCRHPVNFKQVLLSLKLEQLSFFFVFLIFSNNRLILFLQLFQLVFY